MSPQAQVFSPAIMDGGGLRPSPFQFYMTGEENLEISAISTNAGTRILLHGRFWRESDRTIVAFTHVHEIQATDTLETQIFGLSAGALLNLAVFTEEPALTGLKTFVIVRVVRGATGATVRLGTLVQGYIANGQDLGWPGSPLQRLNEEPGDIIDNITFLPASHQSEITVTVPAAHEFEFQAASWTLSTSAVVANRNVTVRLRSASGGVYFSGESLLSIAASSLVRFSVGAGLLGHATLPPFNQILLPFPDRPRLIAGDVLAVTNQNSQVGDVLVGAEILGRSWFRL